MPFRRTILSGLALLLVASPARAEDAFEQKVLPFLHAYCVKCHNPTRTEGELDLTRYTSAAALGEHFRQWEHVVTFLTKEEMPPKEAKQPLPAQRAEVLATLKMLIHAEARKLAGDPGVVLPRRLTGAEYNYSIRDLTGVDIRPAESFPIDPASGEGFNNTGEALVMSPNLFKKYYAAAQHVAEHAVLTPSGMRFAPYPVVTFADQTRFHEQAILRFYEQHDVVYEAYLAAAWSFRHRPAARQQVAIEAWAIEHKLSPRYLRLLWDTLGGSPDADEFYLGWIRRQWNALPSPATPDSPVLSPDVKQAIASLAGNIRQTSVLLCVKESPAIVSNAGNGPVQHIDRRKKTAAERDTFDTSFLLDGRRLELELRKLWGTPSDGPALKLELPIEPGSPLGAKLAASCEAFCKLFPNRFVYVDETRGLSAGFHLIEGMFRDDRPLCKLVLSDDEHRELDRLWEELDFGTGMIEKMLRGFVFFERSERNFLKHADFDSFKEEDPELVRDETLERFEQVYLIRSGVKPDDPKRNEHPVHLFFSGIREGLKRRTAQLAAAQPVYLRQLLEFAERAWRRPLQDHERAALAQFYESTCRRPELGVEQAVRGTLTSILVSPHFCCRIDLPPDGESVKPLADVALASRLSYFLWSSTPDTELMALANAGKLRDEATLRQQTRRMLQDPKVSAFALEFFGQWLRYRDFLSQESVDRNVFPAFTDELRQAMFEEPTRLATHLIQNNLPVTDLLYGDTTFINKPLAGHYGWPYRDADGGWQRVDGIQQHGRGGVLGMAVFLTANSHPQRTSPVKRGFWVVHKILGEHIPAPPNDVATLPAKETATDGKTIRQLMALHTDVETCARCHVRFDPVGLAMEGFDPIGRSRSKDLAGRQVDNVVRLPSGEEARGVPPFLKHLQANRNDDFISTLCHKFLGYALGRSVELSDHELLETMQAEIRKDDYRFMTLFEIVVCSPQFRNQRCKDFTIARFRSE